MHELRDLLRRTPPLTLAVAESVSCGRVQARVGEISGASEFFLGGITAYTLEQKVRHLGVERAVALACDCVSAEVAAQMARGVAALFGADLGVATTGFAERRAEGFASAPPASLRGVAPFGFWAVAHRGAHHEWRTHTGCVVGLGAARSAAQAMIAEVALTELVAHLRALRGNPVFSA